LKTVLAAVAAAAVKLAVVLIFLAVFFCCRNLPDMDLLSKSDPSNF